MSVEVVPCPWRGRGSIGLATELVPHLVIVLLTEEIEVPLGGQLGVQCRDSISATRFPQGVQQPFHVGTVVEGGVGGGITAQQRGHLLPRASLPQGIQQQATAYGSSSVGVLGGAAEQCDRPLSRARSPQDGFVRVMYWTIADTYLTLLNHHLPGHAAAVTLPRCWRRRTPRRLRRHCLTRTSTEKGGDGLTPAAPDRPDTVATASRKRRGSDGSRVIHNPVHVNRKKE